MPSVPSRREILDIRATRDRNAFRQIYNETLVPAMLERSYHKSALFSYALRAINDFHQRRRLTDLQQKIVRSLIRGGIDRRLVQKYTALPRTVQGALGPQSIGATSNPDEFLKRKFEDALRTPSVALGQVIGAFGVVNVASGSILDRLVPSWQSLHHLRMWYRRIKIIRGHDDSGGVDPYLVVGLYRNPSGTTDIIEEVTPFAIMQVPTDLYESNSYVECEMNAAGFSQEFWTSPQMTKLMGVQIYPRSVKPVNVRIEAPVVEHIDVELRSVPGFPTDVTSSPLLSSRDAVFLAASVWERDDDDSAEIVRAFGELVGIAGDIATYMGFGPGILLLALSAALDLLAAALRDILYSSCQANFINA